MSGAEKKHVELIKAFDIFKKNTGLKHRLVLAGDFDKYGDAVNKAAYESEFASDIFLTGYFPHEHFGELYRNADSCVFPAVNEGVGLPVLEAMACGIPVACSSSASLSEMTGSNALFFNSDDIEDIAQKLTEISTDNVVRTDLIEKGLRWTKRFDWHKTSEKLLAIIDSVTKKSSD